MIAQSKMLVFASLLSLSWQERFALALEGDGNGEAVLMLHDGAPSLQATCTEAEYAAISSDRTFDDLIRLAATLPGSDPGPCCIRAVNCGQTLATMGRLRDLLPDTFSRVVVVLNALGGVGGSTALSVNTVYSLTAIPPQDYSFTLPLGTEIGDQIDFTTENLPAGGATFTILDPDSSVMKVYDLETGDRVRYFTAVWNGTSWEVKQS